MNEKQEGILNILIDENIPYADVLFSRLGHVILKAGRTLCADDLIDIDALMIRSVTSVNASLLKKANRLKFVASATAGTDHIDLPLLAERGIFFTEAPGCNKVGVAEYVVSALMVLSQKQGFALTDRTVGIVGAGNVGTDLARCLSALQIPYLLCDPPKEKAGDTRAFHPLHTLLCECDVITLHTPLIKEGKDATHHLIGTQELSALKEGSILINAARGAVVNNHALKEALQASSLTAVLDVFEHEPEVDIELLALLEFATPHIAGYGLEGKARGTVMIFNSFCAFLGLNDPVHLSDLLPKAPIYRLALSPNWGDETVFSLCQLVYDIRRDDADFRRGMMNSLKQRVRFDRLRKDYWDRREYSAITVAGEGGSELESLANLGFTVEEKK